MIKAEKNSLFEQLFFFYNTHLLKKHFHGIFVKYPEDLPDQALLFANHSSWWDGLVLFHLNKRVLKQDIHVMMHEKGLKDFRFFRRLGAYSVNRENPRDILESLRYGAHLLNSQKTACIFPQGDEKHQELRPLGFMPGILSLAEKADAVPLLPIAFYYTFGHQKKQAIYIKIGKPLFLHEISGETRKQKTALLEKQFTFTLDDLKNAVLTEDTADFHNILR